MDVRQLRYFVRIVELGSLGRASIDLGVAQPALTYHIQRLEEETGIMLLHRHRRGISLTEAGQSLLRRAHVILAEVDGALGEVRAYARFPTGRVSLALPPSAAYVLLARLVEAFHRSYPDVCLTVREGHTGYIYQWLVEGAAELAIYPAIDSHKDFETKPLYRYKMCLIGTGKRPGSKSGQVKLRQLADLPLVMTTESHRARQSVDRALAELGAKLSIKAEVDSLESLKQLILSGFGYSVMPRLLFQSELDMGKLWALELCEPEMVSTFALIWPRGRPLSLAAQEVQRILVAQVREAGASGCWDAL
jgi:LysR family transcriptional regulator, nitrogen assimilation regulatory protein